MAQLGERDDFTLRIVVAEPEHWHPALTDEDGAKTRPFKKPQPVEPKRNPAANIERDVEHRSAAPARSERDVEHRSAAPARSERDVEHRSAAPARPNPKPEPLSSDDYDRMLKRKQAKQKIAWARRLLQKFNFIARS
jgi:hypothetical protein